MDETGVSTAHDPGKIIALKGLKQVARIVSGERGRYFTAVCSMNAVGTCATSVYFSTSSDNGSTPREWACGSYRFCTAKWLDGFPAVRAVVGTLHQVCQTIEGSASLAIRWPLQPQDTGCY